MRLTGAALDRLLVFALAIAGGVGVVAWEDLVGFLEDELGQHHLVTFARPN